MSKTFLLHNEIQLSQDLDYEKDKIKKFEVLRVGTWEHPWYGKLEINDKKMRKFVRNFHDNVPQEQIAYDFKHVPDYGAAAWIKKLSFSKNKLHAEVELTPKGYTSLKNKEFLYFSSEFTENYIDFESGKEYGPCILGGGLTNRPFIKGMAPCVLSEDGNGVQFFTNSNHRKEGAEEMFTDKIKTLKDALIKLSESPEDMDAVVKAFEDLSTEAEAEEKDNTEVLNAITQLGEQIDAMKPSAKNQEVVLDPVNTAIQSLEDKIAALQNDDSDPEAVKLAEENAALKASNEQLSMDIKTLSETVTKLGDSIKSLQEKNEKNDKKIYEDSVDVFTRELALEGFWPGMIAACKDVLLSYEGRNSAVVTLSEVSEVEGVKTEQTTDLSMQDVIRKILSAVPQENRIDTSEKSKGPDAQKLSDKKFLSVEEITEIAKERKLNYGECLIQLSKEPEYKDRVDLS